MYSFNFTRDKNTHFQKLEEKAHGRPAIAQIWGSAGRTCCSGACGVPSFFIHFALLILNSKNLKLKSLTIPFTHSHHLPREHTKGIVGMYGAQLTV